MNPPGEDAERRIPSFLQRPSRSAQKAIQASEEFQLMQISLVA